MIPEELKVFEQLSSVQHMCLKTIHLRDGKGAMSTAHLCVCSVPGCGSHRFLRWCQDVGLFVPFTPQFVGP